MSTNQYSNMQSLSPGTNSLYNAQSGLQIPQTTGWIRNPNTISPTRPTILTQHITVTFQLCQEAWDPLSNQMNEIAKTNRLIKEAVTKIYKKFTNVQNQGAKKTPTHMKSVKKTDKIVRFFYNKGRETKENSKHTKKRDDANSNEKNVMTKPDSNTVNEI